MGRDVPRRARILRLRHVRRRHRGIEFQPATLYPFGEILVHEAAWARANDRPIDLLAPMAKLFACQTFRDVTAMGHQVFGGMGSILGSIVTGFGLGIVEGLTKVFYPEAAATVIFIIMALVLLIKPAGLFGRAA